jgi:hypothetical protein
MKTGNYAGLFTFKGLGFYFVNNNRTFVYS